MLRDYKGSLCLGIPHKQTNQASDVGVHSADVVVHSGDVVVHSGDVVVHRDNVVVQNVKSPIDLSLHGF